VLISKPVVPLSDMQPYYQGFVLSDINLCVLVGAGDSKD
jgi:hypothetical protein